SFWFCVETRVRLPDTQCGFRCYPLALVRELKIKSGRYAFELEFMVRASWTGTTIVPVPVKCIYGRALPSHFRPVVDLARISHMNFKLVVQSLIVPRKLRTAWSFGKKESLREMIRDFFTDHAHDPVRLALAVGIGLFCGFAPIWGFQMITTLALAHWLRLNKAIALIASNISIPPVIPVIIYGELVLGHRMLTHSPLNLSRREMTHEHLAQYFWQWCVGSLVLAFALALVGFISTYGIARLWRQK
ncbi:MAG TPA: DUF2062 domain-containing protein, partial [Verrucomicrobiae bacterium]|nr:DUF2062 domain-containing protein [Verrucomicrobiae bacterium]